MEVFNLKKSILDLKKECLSKSNIEYMMNRRRDTIATEVFQMDGDACQTLIDSIRKLPLIPKINAMTVPQVAEYLMLSVETVNYILNKNKGSYLKGLVSNYGANYVAQFAVEKVRVPYTAWKTLTFDNGVTTTLAGNYINFFSPKAVLLTAILCGSESPMCRHIQQRVFLTLTGFGELMEPPTPLPEPINVERHFKPTGRRMSATLHLEGLSPDDQMVLSMNTGRPVVEMVSASKDVVPLTPAKVEKVSEPVIRPMFVAGNGRIRPNQKLSQEINDVIMARYKGFGGNESANALSKVTGITSAAIRKRVHAMRHNLYNTASASMN